MIQKFDNKKQVSNEDLEVVLEKIYNQLINKIDVNQYYLDFIQTPSLLNCQYKREEIIQYALENQQHKILKIYNKRLIQDKNQETYLVYKVLNYCIKVLSQQQQLQQGQMDINLLNNLPFFIISETICYIDEDKLNAKLFIDFFNISMSFLSILSIEQQYKLIDTYIEMYTCCRSSFNQEMRQYKQYEYIISYSNQLITNFKNQLYLYLQNEEYITNILTLINTLYYYINQLIEYCNDNVYQVFNFQSFMGFLTFLQPSRKKIFKTFQYQLIYLAVQISIKYQNSQYCINIIQMFIDDYEKGYLFNDIILNMIMIYENFGIQPFILICNDLACKNIFNTLIIAKDIIIKQEQIMNKKTILRNLIYEWLQDRMGIDYAQNAIDIMDQYIK